MLTVVKTEEAGYESAMRGLAKSKKQPVENMPALAVKLASRDGGHNKFLEAIVVWLDVRAPRYWWQEADTYRISTKQSESTMHTLLNELSGIDITSTYGVKHYIDANFEPDSITVGQLDALYRAVEAGDHSFIKRKLPEGFMQSRMWVVNYRCLRNIILQRREHRLPHWHEFIASVLAQVDHPLLLPKGVAPGGNS